MHCYQAFLCYWDGYHLKKYNEPYSVQMVLTDPSGSWTITHSLYCADRLGTTMLGKW